MTGTLMIQGTASSAGKSLLSAALCRIFWQEGISVAPFKAQNMALNSFVTYDGFEMGRAQVMQAEAAGIIPQVEMNPILLKPSSDSVSQVVVMGRPVGNMQAQDYLHWKSELLPVIDRALEKLRSRFDLIVIEGAGSPAEINLREQDLVNMGLARRFNVPVLLVGDIDRGGVFASLYGTVLLLDDQDRHLLKGVIINKFRGQYRVLEPGLRQLEKLINLPVVGVIPFMNDLKLDDEDSVSARFSRPPTADSSLKIQVVLLPRIANFTDFSPLELFDDVSLSYIREPSQLDAPDLLILPGSKSTIEDLNQLRLAGWEKALSRHVAGGGLLMGICGGMQMLGRKISDPAGCESSLPEAAGFAFLDLETCMEKEKTTRQVDASWRYRDEGFFIAMGEEEVITGYEIHMGRTLYGAVEHPVYVRASAQWEGAVNSEGTVFGTYLHGIFENLSWTEKLLNGLRRRRNLPERRLTFSGTYRELKELEYDKLAAIVRESLHMDQIYEFIGGK